VSQESLNIIASKLLSDVHDALEEENYKGKKLQIFMTRVLFCLYAEDTGVFEPFLFTKLVEKCPSDGDMLGIQLQRLFNLLNTNEATRKKQQKPHQDIDVFPYVNGGLFADTSEDPPTLNARLYKALMSCCYFDWRTIDPVIFGSLFQGLEESEERRKGGQHFTTEKNILRALSPLFLDELKQSFEAITQKVPELANRKNGQYTQLMNEIKKDSVNLMTRLRTMKVLDPACGSGNFLILAYRELRRLELQLLILQQQVSTQDQGFDEVSPLVNLNQFYGIEIDEWAAQIANVAMIITQHQMNLEFIASHISKTNPNFLPLSQQANIVTDNAMTLSWSTLIDPKELSYIVGNPPFIGKQYRSPRQTNDMERIAGKLDGLPNYKNIDYVTLWFIKAVQMMKRNPSIESAFVSTNSICQGEQVPAFWSWVLQQDIHINFAHKTFQWTNEDKGVGVAAVHCIIVGFSKQNRAVKRLFEYADIKGEPEEINPTIINPYLIDAPIVYVQSRTKPLCAVSEMAFGSMPNDGGHLLLSQEEKDTLLSKEPNALAYIKPFLGADEFINNVPRYCLWLKGVDQETIEAMPQIKERVNHVKKLRAKSTRSTTKELAQTPWLFGEDRQPNSKYLLIPRVSSENRIYVPIGYLDKDTICGDANLTIANATLYEFGILTSTMHNDWMRTVSGRLKSDYRYSAKLSYNNFPWVDVTEVQKKETETLAQAILDTRKQYPDKSLAWLYNQATMPEILKNAHKKLDKQVDKLYGLTKAKVTTSDRIKALFSMYQELTKKLV
jgi:type II restriction/modification system DNA methylase subunit YeeA